MTSRSTGSDGSSLKSPSTGIVSTLQFGRPILGRPNQRFAAPAKQVGDALANVGDPQGQPAVSFQGVFGIGSLRRMLLHLTPRELAVHADRHLDNLIAILLASQVMALGALVGPVFETPKGGRSLVGAPGAPFRPRTGHGSFVGIHDGAPSLHRLAIDIDERQLADAIELAKDIRTRLERMKRSV